jgi:predicted nucleic acid-binding protein
LDRLLADEQAELATTDMVVLEVLSGARDDLEKDRLARALEACVHVPQQPWHDAEDAASLYTACRRGGETPRSLIDCLIAAVAIRIGAVILHQDRDFDVIARHAPLRLAT